MSLSQTEIVAAELPKVSIDAEAQSNSETENKREE